MSSKQTTGNKKETSKETMKDTKEAIYQKIADLILDAFPGLKDTYGEKKFEKRIRKVAKLLSEGASVGDFKIAPATIIPGKKTPKATGSDISAPAKKKTKTATPK